MAQLMATWGLSLNGYSTGPHVGLSVRMRAPIKFPVLATVIGPHCEWTRNSIGEQCGSLLLKGY